MYYLRDLYPNMGVVDTRGKTVVDQQERAALGTGRANGASIWMALLVMLAVIVVMGIFGNK